MRSPMARHTCRQALLGALALTFVVGASAAGRFPSHVTAASPVVPGPSSPTPSSLPASSLAPGEGFTWQRADVAGLPPSGIALVFLATNSGGDMSLMGNAFPDQRTSAAWHSTNGRTWAPAKLAWGARKDAGGASNGVVTIGDQFLTIEDNPSGSTALSPTGQRWTVDKQGVNGTKRQALLGAVTSTPDGAAAGGMYAHSLTATTTTPAVWTTPDGLAWHRSDLPPNGHAFITAMAALPSGLLAAAAQGQGAADPAALWVAPDGVTWQAVPLPFLDTDSYLHTLIATDSGLLIVLDEYQGYEAYASSVWSSPDGITWHRVLALDEYIATVSYGPLGVVMTGRSELLRSADDGATWSATPLSAEFDGTVGTVLAQTPDGRLIAGTIALDYSSPALWVGTPAP